MDFTNFIERPYFRGLKAGNFFYKKSSKVTARLGSKHASAYDTSFYFERNFRVGFIWFWNQRYAKQEQRLQNFHMNFFFGQEIKTDIAQTGFWFLSIIWKPDIISLTCSLVDQ